MAYQQKSFETPPPYVANPGYVPPPPSFSQAPVPTIVYQVVGNCPSCHRGILQSNVTCLGVCCAIFLFPIGLVCLFLLQEQRCPLCGYTI